MNLKSSRAVDRRAHRRPPVKAMNYSYRLIGSDTVVIDATGEIGPDEARMLASWIMTFPPDVGNRPYSAFVLDSNGGNPFRAYAIAEVLRKKNVNTGVAENGVCASACVIIWGAGLHKSVSASSRVGVHGATYGQRQHQPRQERLGRSRDDARHRRDAARVWRSGDGHRCGGDDVARRDLLAHRSGLCRLEKRNRPSLPSPF